MNERLLPLIFEREAFTFPLIVVNKKRGSMFDNFIVSVHYLTGFS